MIRRRMKMTSLRGFVNKSAFCMRVLQYLINTFLDLTNDLKWWYFRSMCLVIRVNLSNSAISMHDLFNSWTVQTNSGVPRRIGNVLLIPFNKIINGINSQRAWDKAMYSASAVLRAILFCNFDTKWIGQPAYIIPYQVLDMTFAVLS